MRIWHFAVAILTLTSSLPLWPATAARAASFEAEVHASQEAQNGSSNSSDEDTQETSSSPASASLTFTGSSNAGGSPQRRGTTNANGSASTRFDEDGLEMSVVATNRVTTVTDGGAPLNYTSTVNANATFVDAITLTGGTADETGYIHAVFSLEGTMSSASFGGATPKSGASLEVWAFDDPGGFNLFSLASTNGSAANVPATIDFYMKYKYGKQGPFSIVVEAATFAFLNQSATNVTQSVNLGHTLKFETAEILDKDFVPVFGARIVSASGLVYPHGPLDHIELSPSTSTITAGQSQSYTVLGVDTNGNTWPLEGAATLSITPNGSCTGHSCTATVAGVHTVTANASGKTATATLTVNPGPLHHLSLSPSNATITAGGSQAYTAQGFDQYNNSLGDVTGGTTFSITPNGSCAGASCGATTAGAHTVTGTNTGKTGTASLGVNAGPLDHIALSPSSTTTTSGGSQTYTAQGFDQYDNPLGNVTAGTTFSIAPDGSCNGATCTATVIGGHTVTGNNGGKTGTASFNVVAGPPKPDLAVIAIGNPPTTINKFGKIAASDTVKNQGTAAARFSLVRYYLSSNPSKDSADKRLLGLRIIGGLAPGQSSSGGASLFVFGVTPGTYYLIGCADDTGSNGESDEGNNCLTSSTQIVVQ